VKTLNLSSDRNEKSKTCEKLLSVRGIGLTHGEREGPHV